jgi:hypothetical protein
MQLFSYQSLVKLLLLISGIDLQHQFFRSSDHGRLRYWQAECEVKRPRASGTGKSWRSADLQRSSCPSNDCVFQGFWLRERFEPVLGKQKVTQPLVCNDAISSQIHNVFDPAVGALSIRVREHSVPLLRAVQYIIDTHRSITEVQVVYNMGAVYNRHPKQLDLIFSSCLQPYASCCCTACLDQCTQPADGFSASPSVH